jgi:predicted DNA-binding transcriptional regulator AlpA
VKEASEILGWDKRKVATYMSRGSFPTPIQKLASGSIWTKQQILDYKQSNEKDDAK